MKSCILSHLSCSKELHRTSLPLQTLLLLGFYGLHIMCVLLTGPGGEGSEGQRRAFPDPHRPAGDAPRCPTDAYCTISHTLL